MDLEELRGLLRKAWSRETGADPENWTPENPSWGQCAVTALVVQDFLGGELVRGDAKVENIIYSHYWNRLPKGDTDLTREQFTPDTQVSEKTLRTRDYVLSYQPARKRYALLRLTVENFINPNPLFTDPIYQMCFETALESECQKMKFACLVFCPKRDKEKLVAATANEAIKPLRGFCQPECIRLKIRSRTESMIGACSHAEERALWETVKLGISLEKCSLYIAGFHAKDSKPWIKKEKTHTCLRCTVQMYMAKVGRIYIPVIDRWESLTPTEALETAKEYALKEKQITENDSR